MGILSFLFQVDVKAEILACENRIINFKNTIEITKKNVKNKTEAHYHKHAADRIKTLKNQIQKEKDRIATLKKAK